jgi:hypothetical protein
MYDSDSLSRRLAITKKSVGAYEMRLWKWGLLISYGLEAQFHFCMSTRRTRELPMNLPWEIQRIDATPRCVLEHWQVLEVSPTGACHVPLPGPRFVTFAGCTDHYEIIEFSPEIVVFDPTRMLGVSAQGDVYGLGSSWGFTALMSKSASRSFWKSTLRPRDVTNVVIAMSVGEMQPARNTKPLDVPCLFGKF